jgi:hypothetical protein
MIRTLYSALLQVHPRGFRERFADEMLCIFDEISSPHERAFLLYDGLCSFAVQWLFRSNLCVYAIASLIAFVQAYFIGLHPYR